MKYDGKFASRWRAKSPDALCAVLPYDRRFFGICQVGVLDFFTEKSLDNRPTIWYDKHIMKCVEQEKYLHSCRHREPSGWWNGGASPQRIHLGAGFLKPSYVGEFGHARYSVFEVRAAFALIN